MFETPVSSIPNSFTAGHATNQTARTGCTVIVFGRPAPTVVDVRGGAPGTRETDLLGSGMLVQSVDAIVLSGGSAFGLTTADGVMRHLRAIGRGVSTPAGPVPIVPAAVIYDLSTGQPISPTAEDGASAFLGASPIESLARGLVGAGAGASTGKLYSAHPHDRGGLGYGFVALEPSRGVHAIVVVNAAGIVVDPETGRSVIAPERSNNRRDLLQELGSIHERSSTTLAVVIVDAPVDRRALERCSVAAHDGMARAIRPCHTLYDGDVVFASGLDIGTPAASDILRYSIATELAIEQAILDAVTAS